jgi:AcrR family transcriptional regulator
VSTSSPDVRKGVSSNRDRILDAAWSEVVERGVNAVTLADVGARAGVSRQAVYLHFSNRATLLVAMARRFDKTSGFRDRLTVARAEPPVEAFKAILQAWFAYLPTILSVALALEAANLLAGDGAEAYRDRMHDWWSGIRAAVGRLDDAGALVPSWSPDEAADWAWTSVHPGTYHHLTTERGWSHDAVVDQITGHLCRELLTPPVG